MNQVRSILHVTAGDSDWEPTEIELEELQSRFEEAVASTNECAVVTTRAGVYLEIVSLDSTALGALDAVPQVTQSFDAATGAQIFEFRQRDASSCCNEAGGNL